MRTQAVVLKKMPIREYDELVICYTREVGKQVYQAKGVLTPTSKQAGHLDVLNLVDFSLVHKNSLPRSSYGGAGHPIITSAYCLDAFPRLKSSLPAMSAAYFLLECFDKLIFENEPDARLWDFLLDELRKYNYLPQKLPNLAYAKLGSFEELIGSTRQELLEILGYDSSMPIEHLANSQFKSLQFVRNVIK